MTHAEQVHIETNRSRYTERQLPEESIAVVDVVALAVLRDEQAALLWVLAGVVTGQQRRVVVVPFVHEVETALLHPAGEIADSDGIGIVKERALRIEYGDGRFLDRHPRTAKLRRVGREVLRIEIGRLGVVLHHESPA